MANKHIIDAPIIRKHMIRSSSHFIRCSQLQTREGFAALETCGTRLLDFADFVPDTFTPPFLKGSSVATVESLADFDVRHLSVSHIVRGGIVRL